MCNSKSKLLSYQGYVQKYTHECLTEVVPTFILFKLCILFLMYDTYSEQLLNRNLLQMEISAPCLGRSKAHNATNLLLIRWTSFYILFQNILCTNPYKVCIIHQTLIAFLFLSDRIQLETATSRDIGSSFSLGLNRYIETAASYNQC